MYRQERERWKRDNNEERKEKQMLTYEGWEGGKKKGVG